MKRVNVYYWVFTLLVAVLMFSSGIPNMLSTADSQAMLHDHLGYPLYLSSFLGIAKVVGAIVLLLPFWPRLKEWVYAGFVFDLTGAVYSGLRVGDPLLIWLPVFIGLGLIALSYIFHHKRLRLQNEKVIAVSSV